VLLVVLLLLGCRPGAAPANQWNVIVVMVDTLRADRLGTYGYERDTDPFLRSFSQQGLVFERAYSQAGCTFPSVNSLFTSRSPQLFTESKARHGFGIPPTVPTLAELLQRSGYSTATVSASVVVRATPSEVNGRGGFDAGFDLFDESCENRRAPCVNKQAVKFIDALPEPFFLYLHYLEPHGPYRPPRWHNPHFVVERPEKLWVAKGDLQRVYRRFFDGDTSVVIEEKDLAHLRDLYDEEIRFFDEQFEELVGELNARDLLGRTIVLLVSDHGEVLGEQDALWGHCRSLAYETVVHTPLIAWLPEGPSGRRRALVENLDVMPTLLDLLGLEELAPAELEGVSLAPIIKDDSLLRSYVRSAQGTSRIVSDGRYKLWWDIESQSSEILDLAEDPAEMRDRSADRADELAKALSALQEWLAQVEGPGAAERARQLEEELRALGYL